MMRYAKYNAFGPSKEYSALSTAECCMVCSMVYGLVLASYYYYYYYYYYYWYYLSESE